MTTCSTDERLAATVRAEMARGKNTQSELARRAGMTQQALSRRLSGRTPFTVAELSRIADVLGVRMSALLDDLKAAS